MHYHLRNFNPMYILVFSRLWLEPYFDAETQSPQEEKMFELACTFSPMLELEETVVYKSLAYVVLSFSSNKTADVLVAPCIFSLPL